MRSRESEIDENDGDGDQEPVAGDGEQPRVARVAFVDETARRTSLDVARPAGEQRSDSAVRTAPRHAAPERREHESDAGMRAIAETIAHREWIETSVRRTRPSTRDRARAATTHSAGSARQRRRRR